MSRVFIIGEAGVNHNGNLNLAKQLVDVAVEAGVDAIKFQTFKSENLVTTSAKQANYQIENLKEETSQIEMLKKLELSVEDHKELISYCKDKGVMFLSSPFDLDSIDLLSSFNMNIFKIPSSEIENVPYLRKVARVAKKIILSTGMSTLSNIEFALNLLYSEGAKDVIVLHCNTAYPTKMSDVNLLAMNTIKKAFKVKVGYSDHTKGIEVPIAAVALGAEVIEKHFTLDKNMAGPDHKASLNPEELCNMVSSIRNIELALGDGIKNLTESEKENAIAGKKSIVSLGNIKKGDIFTSNNISVKRPGNGISPKNWDEIIGMKAKKDFKKDDLIEI
ncbi:N-acetylneuraminate synthase [Clostridium sp. MB05]